MWYVILIHSYISSYTHFHPAESHPLFLSLHLLLSYSPCSPLYVSINVHLHGGGYMKGVYFDLFYSLPDEWNSIVCSKCEGSS